MNATVCQNKIEVRHSIRKDVNREFLAIAVPNGWSDVQKISRKILLFDGREFAFTGWNSDTLECYFARELDNSFPIIATIK